MRPYAVGTWVAVLSLVAAMASLQLAAAMAKQLFAVVGVLETTFIRLAIAAIIMALMLRPWRATINSANWRPLVLYGASLAGMNGMFYLAIDLLPLGIATAVQFLGPLSVAVLGSRRRIDLVWSALAAAGLLLITEVFDTMERINLVGLGWALGGAVCWALYIVFGQHAGRGNGVQTAALGMALAAVFTLPFGVSHMSIDTYTGPVLLMLLAVAILSAVIPYTLEMVGLRALPARRLGS
ncbi:MAG: EamA family transporter [Hyphomicrobiales bacterium]